MKPPPFGNDSSLGNYMPNHFKHFRIKSVSRANAATKQKNLKASHKSAKSNDSKTQRKRRTYLLIISVLTKKGKLCSSACDHRLDPLTIHEVSRARRQSSQPDRSVSPTGCPSPWPRSQAPQVAVRTPRAILWSPPLDHSS